MNGNINTYINKQKPGLSSDNPLTVNQFCV